MNKKKFDLTRLNLFAIISALALLTINAYPSSTGRFFATIPMNALRTTQTATHQWVQPKSAPAIKALTRQTPLAHTPVFTVPSRWSRFMNYFKRTPEPTLAQIAYYLAYHEGAVTPSLYPLKKVLDHLKKRTPDPKIYKECVISLCTKNKRQLQKLLDTQVYQQQYAIERQMRKGLEHSAHWLRRYNEGMKDIATAKTAALATETKLLAASPTKLLTANTQPKALTNQPTASFNQVQQALNQEIRSAQQLTKYAVPKATTATTTETKLLIASPTKLLTANTQPKASKNQPTASFNQIQHALNQKIHSVQQLTKYAIPTATTTETKLLTASPTKQRTKTYGYTLPTAASIAGISSYYAWHQSKKPDTTTTIAPTMKLPLAAIVVVGVIAYKTLRGTQKKEKTTQPKETTTIPDKRKSVIQSEDSNDDDKDDAQ